MTDFLTTPEGRRIAYRLTHKPPPLPASIPGWQRGAAANGVLRSVRRVRRTRRP